MSFLKNILGAFVEFNEEDKSTVGQAGPVRTETINPTNKDNTKVAKPNVSYTPTSGNLMSSSSHSTAEYQKHFEELIDEANVKNPIFSGTDFKEFIDSKSDVEAITDEPTKYRTAFNVLKRTGLTKERLLSTGQEYINVIDSDLRAFENAFKQQYGADVEQKEQRLQQKAQELQALTEKITQLNQEMKQMSQEVIQSKDKLNTNKSSFVSAGENKKNEIKAELQKIEQYF